MSDAASRLNDYTVCICCARRSDGLAVGKPGHLAWFCSSCGPDLAKIALAMIRSKELDVYEKSACAAVAALCTGPVTLSSEEMPDFIAWAVREFGPAIRKEVEGGKPPF